MKTMKLLKTQTRLWTFFYKNLVSIASENFFPYSIILLDWALSTHIPRTTSTLVQVMVCRPFGAKPLHCWLVVNWALKNELQWDLNQITEISFMKMHLKASSVKWRPFCPGRYEFIHQTTLVYSIYRKSTQKWAILFPYPELCSTFYHRAPNPRKYHVDTKNATDFVKIPGIWSDKLSVPFVNHC